MCGIPGDQIKALQSDPAFAAAEHIQGTHYPCARDQPPAFWEIVPKQTYWANEDFSTIGGDWDGGSCWGRSLNQNFVKLNATATISWSTIWSVYDSWRYFGNGLMYAMVSYQDIAGIWVAFFSRWQRYRCRQGHGARPARPVPPGVRGDASQRHGVVRNSA